MENNKKAWLIEQYAQKAWTVSLTLRQEAARAGQNGKGYAVVAREARTFANKLFEYAAQLKFDSVDETMFKGVVDFAVMMKLLSVNAMLETVNMVNISMDFNIPKSMAVFADELRDIAVELNELAGNEAWKKPFTIPEFSTVSESGAYDNFFLYSINGNPLIESVKKIKEVFYRQKKDIEENVFIIRGEKMPVINCYKRLQLPNERDWQTVIVIKPNNEKHENGNGLYAVPIDDLDINAIFDSYIGCDVPSNKKHAFANYARECWDAVGGEQLIFVDWNKLIE